MIIALPHKTSREYRRDFQVGTLEKFCPVTCPLCPALISFFAFRKRKVLNIFVLRARCKGPLMHYFTFLPLFVAPAKWYGYEDIEVALVHVNHGKFAYLNAALAAWENLREIRIDDHKLPGPSSKTVYRWQTELSQHHPDRPWGKIAEQALLQLAEPESSASKKRNHSQPRKKRTPLPGTSLSPTASFPEVFLSTLLTLGKILVGSTSFPLPVFPLGIGMWFLETRCQQRILARVELAGKVVPGPVPYLSVLEFFLRGYPPFS